MAWKGWLWGGVLGSILMLCFSSNTMQKQPSRWRTVIFMKKEILLGPNRLQASICYLRLGRVSAMSEWKKLKAEQQTFSWISGESAPPGPICKAQPHSQPLIGQSTSVWTQDSLIHKRHCLLYYWPGKSQTIPVQSRCCRTSNLIGKSYWQEKMRYFITQCIC